MLQTSEKTVSQQKACEKLDRIRFRRIDGSTDMPFRLALRPEQ